MSTKKTKDIKVALIQKGFSQENRDHSFFFLYVNGLKTSIRTKISYGMKEYGDNLLAIVARQLHLSYKELNDLIDCPLSYENYISILKEKQIIQI